MRAGGSHVTCSLAAEGISEACLASGYSVSTQEKQPCDLHGADDQEVEAAGSTRVPFPLSPDVVGVLSLRWLRMPGRDPNIPLVKTSVLWAGVYL